MPSFVFEYDDVPDGRIKTIYKDGKPLTESVQLETPQGIVRTYFTAAKLNLSQMTSDTRYRQKNRHYGLQSFLMSLVGLEAFLNVHFHMLGREKGLLEVVKAVTIGNGTVEAKIKNLSQACYGRHLPGHRVINKRIPELYNLRSAIVHPKWEPSTLGTSGLVFDGVTDNFQTAFQDLEFCREALSWCLLVVARVGVLQWPTEPDAFLLQWTGLGETNAEISAELGVPET